MAVNPRDPKRYWNLKDMFAKLLDENSYEDWEGFSDNDELLEAFEQANGSGELGILWTWINPEDEPIGPDLVEKFAFGKDLILHWMHENVNEAEMPSERDIQVVIDFVGMLLGTNFKMRSDAE
jgi:hypothetical protein